VVDEFADEDLAFGVGEVLAQFADVLERLGPVELMSCAHDAVARVEVGAVLVVGQLRILAEEVDHVDAETVGAARTPERDDVADSRADLGVGPVQFRLVRGEVGQVPLIGRLVVDPRAARTGPDLAAPVVWRQTGTTARSPPVPVPLR
jgi:hypothetical protein